MPTTDMMQQLLSSPLARAALHHRACGSQSEPLLRAAGLDPVLFQLWNGLGRAVLELFSARRCIGAVGCETAGMATMAVRDLRHALLMAIADEARERFLFAPTQPQSEQSSQAAEFDIAERLVGAIAYERGLDGVIRDLLSPVASSIRAVKVSKDPKTVLQELLQSQHQRPAYELVTKTGPEHQLVFEVRVATPFGASALGKGVSKKAAELAAAANLLRDRYPSADVHHNIQLRPDFDVPGAVDSIAPLHNGKAAISLCAEIGLPLWSAALVSLSLVHRSRGLQAASKFGKDNSILAHLGSYVIAWAAKDHCLRCLSGSQLLERAGVQNVSASLFSYSSMIHEVNWLFVASLTIVRSPEDMATEGVRKELLQALLGAIFLAREQNIHSGVDVVNGVPGLQSFWESAADRIAARDALLPSKTVLQEKLQAVGVEARYVTQATSNEGELVVRPRLQLRSPFIRDTLLITGRTQTYSGEHEREPNVLLEGELAKRFLSVYAFVMGVGKVDATGELTSDIDRVRAWLFSHFRGLLSHDSVVARDIQSEKLLRDCPMGIEHLVKQDLDGFDQWFRRSAVGFDGWPSYLQDLLDLYGAVGHRSNGDQYRAMVLAELDHLATVLRASDPLIGSDMKRGSSELQRLIDLATVAKLRSEEVVEQRLEELAEQVRLLYRVPIELRASLTAPRLVERRGAHLALVGLVLDAARAASDGVPSLVASVGGHGCTLQVNKTGTVSDIIQGRVEHRLLWRGLVSILGIDNVREDSERWSGTIPSVASEDVLSRDVLNCWLAFRAGGRLAAATDRAMATLLHDVKNEVLAYLSAESQAKAAARSSDRYSLAAAASRHAEQALSQVDVIRALLSSAEAKSVTSMNLASLFRSMTNEVLAWLPASVHLEMPKVEPTFNMCTNEDALRSLLGNLVRNAYDALPASGGSIGIECMVDEDAGQVEFEVRDSGGGFRPEQLEALNRGEPISTTKQDGSGLGLLTVLLLADSLGGRASFSSKPGAGSRVLLSIPMNAAEAPEQARAIDTSLPTQEVNLV